MSEQLSDLIGKTLTKVENLDGEEIRFTTEAGETFKLFHYQDCCESVRVEDIAGNLDDLVGSPLLMAEESSNSSDANDAWPEGIARPDYLDSWTWTFYRFGTMKGYVTIRFLGESNGYYSESVSFAKC